jgi:hypothetical protein
MRHPECVPSIPVSHTVVTPSGAIFRRVRKIAKTDNYLRPHGTIRLPFDRFSWNLIFEDFSKIAEKIQVLLKSDKNRGYFTRKPISIFDHISLSS